MFKIWTYTNKLTKTDGSRTDVLIDGQWYIFILLCDKGNQN